MAVPPRYVQYPRGQQLPPAGRVRFEIIGEAFQMFSSNAGAWIVASLPLVGVTLVYYILYLGSMLPSFGMEVPALLAMSGTLFMVGLNTVYFFLIYLLIGGLIKMGIKQARGEAISAGDALAIPSSFGKFLVAILLVNLAVVAGMIFCIVPGLMLSGLLMLTYPLVLDKELGPIEAMQVSWDTVKQDMWTAVGVMLVLGLIYGIAINTCVGAIVGAPIYALGLALVYRDFFITPQILAAGGPGYEPPPYSPPSA